VANQVTILYHKISISRKKQALERLQISPPRHYHHLQRTHKIPHSTCRRIEKNLRRDYPGSRVPGFQPHAGGIASCPMAAATNWCFGYNEIFAGEFELEEVESFQRHNLSTQMITEALPAVRA